MRQLTLLFQLGSRIQLSVETLALDNALKYWHIRLQTNQHLMSINRNTALLLIYATTAWLSWFVYWY